MPLDRERQPGRPAVQPKEATQLPGAPHDARTIIARLKKPGHDPRSYHGYVTFDGASGAVPRYYVYLDQFEQPHTPPQRGSRRDAHRAHRQLRAQLDAAETANTELRAANADLQARLTVAESEADRLRAELARAEAGRARDQDVIRMLAATNALMADAAETIQESAEGFQHAGEKALEGARKYLKVAQLQRDVVTQYITPDDLSELPPT